MATYNDALEYFGSVGIVKSIDFNVIKLIYFIICNYKQHTILHTVSKQQHAGIINQITTKLLSLT